MNRPAMGAAIACALALSSWCQPAERFLTPVQSFVAGLDLLSTDRHDEGVAMIDRAINMWTEQWRAEPGNAALAFHIGVAHRLLGRSGDAIRSMEEATRLSPESGEYRYELGVLLRDVGRTAEAVASLELAMALEPGKSEYRITLADLIAPTNPQQAAELYRSAAALEPQNITSQFAAATGLKRLTLEEEARVLFEGLVKLEPKTPMDRRARAAVLISIGRMAEAAVEYDELSRQAPDDHEALIRLMEMQERLNDAEAIDRVRARLVELRRSGRNAALNAMDYFFHVRIELPEQGHFAIAEEWFELEGQGNHAVLLGFTLYDAGTGKPIDRVSLGSYEGTVRSMRQSGQIGADQRIYHVDRYGLDGSHETYAFLKEPLGFTAMRDYALRIFYGGMKPSSATRIRDGMLVIEQEGQVVQSQALPPGFERNVPRLPWMGWLDRRPASPRE